MLPTVKQSKPLVWPSRSVFSWEVTNSKPNFVVVDVAMGVEDFLLGRNFLRAYQVLVDLTSMKIVVRAPVKPVWRHAHTQ